ILAAPAAAEALSVYLTWQKDPTTTMTIQWITDQNKTSDDVYYQKIGDSQWKSVAGSHFSMPKKKPYLIHRTELTGLEPGASYQFRTGDRTGTIYKFRTMPKNASESIRFVVGGDMYHD